MITLSWDQVVGAVLILWALFMIPACVRDYRDYFRGEFDGDA